MTNAKHRAVTFGLLIFASANVVAAAKAELPRQQLYSLFTEANNAFRQANATQDDAGRQKLYQQAILNFEKIIQEGRVKNGRLYYNLANTYFLKGDIGRAILNYRRAEKLEKGNPDIHKNLAFARQKRADLIKPKTEERVLQTLFFWHYDFSAGTRFLITCLCFAAVCISLTIMIWRGRSTAATLTAMISALLMLCFLTSVIVESTRHANTAAGVIVADQVVAHQADWESSPPSFKDPLHAGTEFDLLDSRHGWLHIQLADGSDGWIPQNAAELI